MSKRVEDGCMTKTAATTKEAGGITVYLLEELGDARLRCAQLKKYVKEALDLVEKSEKRDHFFEIAAHLIHGIPDTLFKLEKALDASAMAGARLDYEEIKQTLKPEKADELEDVLEDVRLRYLKRRSQEPMMTPKQAAEQLLAIADQTEATGQVPLAEVMTLLASLESQTKKASVDAKAHAFAFRAFAETLKNHPDRGLLITRLRGVVAEALQPTMAQVAASIYQTASSREEVMKGFSKANPHMSQEDLEKAADMWEKHKDSLKSAASPTERVAAPQVSEPALDRYIGGIERAAKDLRHHLSKSADSRPYDDMGVLFNQIRSTATTAMRQLGLKMAADNSVDGSVPVAKFEEGKPADPTKDMSEEQKAEWWKHHEENKDKFKAAATLEQVQAWKKELLSEVRQPTASATIAEVEAQTARFQEGKPADPTQNMDEDDKSEWWKKHEENKDNFKEKSASEQLHCDMESDCKEPVTHIDNKGWLYCTKHGQQRKGDKPCRALKPAEIKKLEAGQTIRYASDEWKKSASEEPSGRPFDRAVEAASRLDDDQILKIFEEEGLSNLGSRYGKRGDHFGIQGSAVMIRYGMREMVLMVYGASSDNEGKFRDQWSADENELLSKLDEPELRKWAKLAKTAPSMLDVKNAVKGNKEPPPDTGGKTAWLSADGKSFKKGEHFTAKWRVSNY